MTSVFPLKYRSTAGDLLESTTHEPPDFRLELTDRTAQGVGRGSHRGATPLAFSRSSVAGLVGSSSAVQKRLSISVAPATSVPIVE